MKDLSNNESGTKVLFILGIAMMLVGIFRIIDMIVTENYSIVWSIYDTFDVLAFCIMIFAGATITIFRTKLSVIQKISVVGIGIGSSFVLDNVPTIAVLIEWGVWDAFVTILDLLQVVYAVLIIYFSVLYMRGNVRNGFRIVMFLLFSLFTTVFLMLFNLINQKIPVSVFLQTYYIVLITMVIYTLFIISLMTPGASVRGSFSRMKKAIDLIVDSSATPPESTMTRSEMKALVQAFASDSLWSPSREGLPCREYRARIGADRSSAKVIIMRRFDGSPEIRVTVTGLLFEETVQATRFVYLCHEYLEGDNEDDCGLIRIYGKGGFFIDVLIEDIPEKRKMTLVKYLSELDRSIDDREAESRLKHI